MIQNVKKIKDVFNALIASYRNNEALCVWCNSEFSKQPKIQIGIDDEDPPELAPGSLEIHVIPGARSRTRQMSKRSHGLVIRAYAHCETDDQEADALESDIRVIKAVDIIDTFVSLIEEATIPTLEQQGIAITPLEGAPDEIIYPYAKAELAYMIEIPSILP